MDRADVHRLVDQFPSENPAAVARVLEALKDALAPGDPVAQALDSAPLDDEPLTDGDLQAVREGSDDWREGRICSHEEALRRAARWDTEETSS